jgi:hypothetical protein
MNALKNLWNAFANLANAVNGLANLANAVNGLVWSGEHRQGQWSGVRFFLFRILVCNSGCGGSVALGENPTVFPRGARIAELALSVGTAPQHEIASDVEGKRFAFVRSVED